MTHSCTPPPVTRIAITPGEPAGIGPDLCVLLAQQAHDAQLVAVCDPQLLLDRAAQLGLPLQLHVFSPQDLPQSQAAGSLSVLPVKLPQAVCPGELNPDNAPYVLQCLSVAAEACLQKTFAALVTGPLHKGVINQKGIAFTGHTEFLAEKTGASRPVMMLLTEGLRVALATTHLPLAQVSQAITQASLQEVIEILHRELKQHMGIDQPVIHVCGLNPHAGEQGHLGRE